ncbi:LacI family DNA-binding transcriptional regulator [Streptacidiphilus sp. N1-12]|uniref:LacI family DNA-binding transcriptional regulator n=2 Tax=Streptacidiphilus alkalitolerans TaxID=3342712 RepID=A0ABV6WRW9_9ACTN
MADVAKHAGVAPMTVSRALHDDPRVSPSTRVKVLASVAALGYRRNEVARSLRAGQSSDLLGLVVTNLANPFYAQLALGVESFAAEHGMTMVLGNTAEDPGREKELVNNLVSRRVSGIIVVPAGSDHSHLRPSGLDGMPVVLAARPPSRAELDCVLVDDFGGALAAARVLTGAGHRRIGFLGPLPGLWTSAERFRGFCTALAEAGLAVDEQNVRFGLRDVPAAEHAARELLHLADPPTALFAANNRSTIGAVRAITGARPRTALAGFDDFELADMLGLPLTVAAYDPAEIGMQAARLLIDRIDRIERAGNDTPPQRVVVPTTLTHYGQA